MKNMKQCKVIMLPSKDRKGLFAIKISGDIKECPVGSFGKTNGEIAKNNPYWKAQHLYLVSNDEIKEGDWYYNKARNIINQFKDQDRINDENWLKVIATTDSSLKLSELSKEQKTLEKHLGDKVTINSISQIPQSFVEAYIKVQGKIDEVMVETVPAKFAWDNNDEKNPFSEYENSEQLSKEELLKMADVVSKETKLKLRPDNTVIIHQAKTYSREEVIKLTNLAYWRGSNDRLDNWQGDITFNKWIEENL